MSENEVRYLDLFATWLGGLGVDAEQMASVLEDEDASQAAREASAKGLNYLFKSLDLIPDGVDDIGYLDDAFVLRVAARQAADAGESTQVIARLAKEATQVQAFLGENYARLDAYVAGLRGGAARGRAVTEILSDANMLAEFLHDVKSFARDFRAPGFSKEPKTLIKLSAFFDAKLPR